MAGHIYDGKKINQRANSFFLFILLFAGLTISVYLFYQHYLIINEANGPADICYKLFSKGCSRALASGPAVQLGLPLAGWGIIYYILLLALLLFYFKNKNKTGFPVPIFIISLLGCIGSITLLIMIFFDHALFCPFCVIIHGINLLLFFIASKFIYDDGFFTSPFKQSHSDLKFNSIKPKAATLILPVIILYIIMELILIPGKIIFDAKTFIKEFDASPLQTIVIDKDDPVAGPVSAPLQLVVFSDFECPACRNFSKVIAQLRQKHGNKFYVVFKNFPLGKQCNPIFGDYDLHPKACEAARAAEAARLQGKFWKYHDRLFSIDLERNRETFLSIAIEAGLDGSAFISDMNGKKVNDRLDATIGQGKKLGIKGTPAVFLNGQRVTDYRLGHLEILIDHLLSPGFKYY